VNGYLGVDFSSPSLTKSDLERACRRILSDGGCVGFLITLITSSDEVYAQNLPMIADIIESGAFDGRVIGVHLEGPFISPKRGARGCHPSEHCRSPDVAYLKHLCKLARGHVKMITLAPELPGAVELVEAARALGVAAVSLGHTLATKEEIERAVDAGATMATHVMNGLPNLIHRHKNPIWPLLADDRVSTCIIADGSHVPVSALTTIVRAKGRDNVILTSDASPPAGLSDGFHLCFGQRVRVEGSRVLAASGENLAGSGTLLNQCVRFMRQNVPGISSRDIEAMAFYNPLRAIGIDPGLFLAPDR